MHYNSVIIRIFVNKIYKFKAKDSEISAAPLFLGKVSKKFSIDNMKKAGLYGYVYKFSADYDGIDVDDIFNISKYLDIK